MSRRKLRAEKILTIVGILAAQVPNANAAGQNLCTLSNNSEIRMNAVKAEYDKYFADHQKKIQERADKIKTDVPDPNAAEVTINGAIEFRPNLREFKFDAPQATIKPKKMAMHLPKVANKTRMFATDVPTVVMEMQCGPGVPQVKIVWKMCSAGPIKTKCNPQTTVSPGPEICTKIPKTKMVRQETKFDVPEIKMERTEWVMNVPEFKMVTQVYKINIPDIIVSDVQGEISKNREESQKLSEEAESEARALSSAMTAEIKSVSLDSISELYSCQAKNLDIKMKEESNKIEVQETGLAASLNQARSINATDLVKSYELALKEFQDAREKMKEEFYNAKKKLVDDEKKALQELI